MPFAAGVPTKSVLWLLIFLLLLDQILSDTQKCYFDCGGNVARFQAEKKGELLCVSESKGRAAATTCERKCDDTKPDEDQLQCWKNLCVGSSRGFCEKPGVESIQPEQCEEYLNEGKVKFHGRACKNYSK